MILSHLGQKQARGVLSIVRATLELGAAAHRIGRGGGQKLRKSARRALVELSIGAARQARDLSKVAPALGPGLPET